MADRQYLKEPFLLQNPLNRQGVLELTFRHIDRPNCKINFLTRNECRLLFPLFDEFSDRFDIMIDYFESETIPAGRVPEALELTRQRIGETTDPVEIHGLETLKDSLESAKAHNTFLRIDLVG